ncbi:MAG TPA: PQQ-dependent sugar dehydrogenase [Flavisolibacter sp.]
MKKKQFFIPLLLLAGGSLFLQNCSKSDAPAAEETALLKKIPALDLQLVASNFTSPIGLVAFPDNSNRLAVIDQIGKIWIIDGSGNTLATPFLDISSMMVTLSPGYDERGLIGLAFHPSYASNGRFYVYYNAPPRSGAPVGGTAWNNLSVISEFMVSSNPNVANPASERRLFEIDDPQSNHNGGTMEFGPDGYLYIAIGDGGGANDVAPGHVEDWYPVNQGGNAQNIEANLFGKILRIDVNSGNPYGIPADNPFVGKPGLDEIYAYGLRNPFRFSFDMGGFHDLIAGDAGQLLYEEIDLIEKGGNYGWNVKEGNHCFNAASNLTTFATCPNKDVWNTHLSGPVIEINNWRNPAGGRATTIIGGNVYRGQSIPSLYGKYIFGTFSQTPTTANGELFMAQTSGKGNWSYQEISLASSPNDIGYYLKGFGQDRAGEVYLTVSTILGPSGSSGKVFKLVTAP